MLISMPKSGTVFVLLFLAATTVARAGTAISADDLSWLKKISAAARQAEYSGTYIYQSGNYVETSRITHVLEGENEHERLEGLDGERSEIIRKNNQIWCYLGDSKVMVAKRGGARTFPALLPEQLDLLLKNYQISDGKEDRVAGFHAHSIVFRPKDRMRYSHKMWAHNDSGLLLKAVVMDEHEHVIEQYAFTQLKIGGDIDRKWIRQEKPANQKDENSSVITPDQDSGHIPSTSGWNVYALPVGFKKIAEVSRRLRGNDLPVTHLVYSDGLVGISVFIEKLGEKSGGRQGLYSNGVIHVFTKVLDKNLLTVVGEVPPLTVMKVAESVRYEGGGQ